MFGKPQWFERRKYTGWGFTPKAWQGWVYVIAMILPIFAIQFVPAVNARIALWAVWGVVLLADFLIIMKNLPKDEREKIHEAVAERNALWTMIAVLIFGFAFQAAKSFAVGSVSVIDPMIVAALFAGTVAKALTNFYLDKKD